MCQLDDIEKHEVLIRAIFPQFLVEPRTGKINSGAFKDPNGCSVDRVGNRCCEHANRIVVERFKKQDCKHVGNVKKSDCDEIGLFTFHCATKKNDYHCEIHDSKNKRELTDVHANQLANRCELIVLLPKGL